MNKTTLIAASIVILSGLIGATPLIINETSIDLYEKSYESNISVLPDSGNNTSIGINSDQDLDFGYMPEGSNSTKFLNISTQKKSILDISSEGNISEFLVYEDRMYFQGFKKISVEAQGREPGNYTGNITLNFQIPENQVGGKWLDLKYWYHNSVENLITETSKLGL